ncbi:hypothetical protein ANO14919_050240 [Xylariales sp. No.14919]|nr:hypothetical protein ANO14919_050240 [Xylariales sp. No.14919]
MGRAAAPFGENAKTYWSHLPETGLWDASDTAYTDALDKATKL